MSEVKTNSGREYYLDVARVFSMISVILIHVGAISWYDAPFSLYPWGVMNFMDLMSRYCVPVFLMISGYIFLDPKKEIPTKKLYSKYLPRLLAAFFFWSFLYALITSGFVSQRTLGNGVGEKLLKDTFWGHYHMWYMYIIVAMYIITPALRPIAANVKAMKYFLIISYVFSFLIPTIQMIPFIYEHTARYTGRLELNFISGYIFYYLAGYLFGSEDFSPKARKVIYGLAIAGFIFAVISTSAYIIINQYPDSIYHEYYTAGVPLYSVASFLFFKDMYKNVNPNTKLMKIVLWFSKMSFGIYLAHDFGLIVFKKIGLTPAICTPFISMPLLTIIDLAITTAIVFVVSKIPVLKKWVM